MKRTLIYQLLLHNQDTNERLAFFTDNPDEADAHCKRVLEAEHKKGVRMEGIIVTAQGVPQSFVGKWFNLRAFGGT